MSESRGFITACEQEALHLSGAIQGHGALLVCDAEQRVTHASANLHEWLGQLPETLIGQPLPAELADCLAALDGAPGRRLQLNALAWLEHETALNAVRTDAGGMLVELLPALGSHPEPFGLRAPAEASPLAFRTEAELHAARDGLLDMLLRHSCCSSWPKRSSASSWPIASTGHASRRCSPTAWSATSMHCAAPCRSREGSNPPGRCWRSG